MERLVKSSKVKLILFFVLIGLGASAQDTTLFRKDIITSGFTWNAGNFHRMLKTPTDTTVNKTVGSIAFKNGVFYVKTTAAWVPLAEHYVNVKSFGATGDGSTNDATAIQNAINGQSGDVNLFFPQGTYKISTELLFSSKSNIRILGNNAVLKSNFSTDSLSLIHISGGSGRTDIEGVSFDLNNINHVSFGLRIRNRTLNQLTITKNNFYGYGTLRSVGIWLNRSNYITNSTAYISGVPAAQIRDCNFYDSIPSDYNNFIPFNMAGTALKGIGIQADDQAEYGLVEGCNFSYMGTAIYFNGGANWKVSDNNFLYSLGNISTNLLSGIIHVKSTSGNQGKYTIINNRFNHNFGFSIYSDISVVNTPIDIAHNQFIANAAMPIKLKDGVGHTIEFNFFDRINDGLTTSSPFTNDSVKAYIGLTTCTDVAIRNNSFRYSVNSGEASYAVRTTGLNNGTILAGNYVSNTLLPLSLLSDVTSFIIHNANGNLGINTYTTKYNTVTGSKTTVFESVAEAVSLDLVRNTTGLVDGNRISRINSYYASVQSGLFANSLSGTSGSKYEFFPRQDGGNLVLAFKIDQNKDFTGFGNGIINGTVSVLGMTAATQNNLVYYNTSSGLTTYERAPFYGSYSGSGNAFLTSFSVSHSLGTTPSQVIVTPTHADAVGPYYISARDASTFTITFITAPASGTNNVKFDFQVIK